MKDSRVFKRLVIAAVLVWMVLFAFAPNLLVLMASLGRTGDTAFVVPGLSLDAYRRLLEPVYGQILLSSLYLAGGVTLICLVCGYPFAAILARTRPPWRGWLLLLVVIPFWTNSLVRTYAMIAILNANGIVNRLLTATGLISAPLPLMYTTGAVLAGLVYTLLPFMVLPLYAALERLDPRYVEAARDLGATPARTFVRIVLPLTMPGIVSGCMLVFLPAVGMFYVADVLGGARTMLLGNFIRDQFLTSRDWPFGAAASVALTLVMGLMLLLYWRSNVRLARKELA
ncbi:spermidine/putrescine ABC transporter permease PotB [Desulfatitalea tepidiphila]|uniref:spermidine/putrescine ABC transporter permease PotB n=1 Tax=Desulfatitalea tepidiphila TaxID=1185843 RepID=UPI0006B59D84|nr:spermidine/putrescine ABC transporter permease PotB [Desulfatitalea tepidiphila]